MCIFCIFYLGLVLFLELVVDVISFVGISEGFGVGGGDVGKVIVGFCSSHGTVLGLVECALRLFYFFSVVYIGVCFAFRSFIVKNFVVWGEFIIYISSCWTSNKILKILRFFFLFCGNLLKWKERKGKIKFLEFYSVI